MKRRKRKGAAIAGGLAAGGIAAVAASAVAFAVLPLQGRGPAGTGVLPYGDAIGWYGHWLLAKATPFFKTSWAARRDLLTAYGLADGFGLRAGLVTASSLMAASLVGLGLLEQAGSYMPGYRHLRGRQLREAREAVVCACKALQPGIEKSGRGIELAPGVPLSRDRETEGFLVSGAPGGGKSVILRFWMAQIHERSKVLARMHWVDGVAVSDLPALPDRMIVVDAGKGAETAAWPDNDFILFAPHDSGVRLVNGTPVQIGHAWDIAKDIRGVPAARDFADMVVPETREPVWGEAARSILTGALVGCQREKGDTWGFRDLHRALMQPAIGLRLYLDEHFPEAARYVEVTQEGNPTRQTQGYLASLYAGVLPLVDALARAWGDENQPRVSLTEWILNPLPAKRTIILQRSGELKKVSAAWIRAVLQTVGKFVTSPRLSDNPKGRNAPGARRVWLFADELPRFASKDDGIEEIVATGRSRGFGMVITVQVAEQMAEVWSDPMMKTMLSMCKTQIITQTLGPAAEYVAEHIVGSSDHDRLDVQYSSGGGKSEGRSVSRRSERLMVILPNYLSEKCYPHRNGVNALYITPADACNLRWPFDSWSEQRLGTVPANWVTAVSDVDDMESAAQDAMRAFDLQRLGRPSEQPMGALH